MGKVKNTQIEQLNSYCRRLEEIVAKRSAEFALLNSMLTRESREHRMTEDGLSLRAKILDNTGEAVFLINQRGDFTYANETAINLYGYNRDEFLQMQVYQLRDPSAEARAIELKNLEEVRTKGHLELETAHKRKDGSLMPVRMKYRAVPTSHGDNIIGVVGDISGEQQLRSVFKRVSGVIWTTDNNLRLTSVMCAGSEEMGFETYLGTGTALPEFLEQSGIGKEVADKFSNALASESVTQTLEIDRFGKNFRGWVAPFRDSTGRPAGTVCFLIDATPAN
jgi:PAS domain S-box-containing protein